ncbi:MAG: M56 family metallopeptidase [Gudongella sp.]|nr:M56 family metallopeptidase [Gudongella sp.]
MLDKVFLQVINMSYIGSLVILFVLAARILLKKAPKKYTYILWIVVLCRLIVPISFESVLSLIPVNPTPISNDILYNATPQIDTGITNIDQSIATSIPKAEVMASVNPMQIWIRIGLLIWIAGMVILLIYGITTLIKMKRKVEDASLYKDNIYKAENIESPFVLGLVQPKIYLPAFLSETEEEYIVLHERTHIKRFDHVSRFISYLVLCIHWFNPLVWITFWISGEDMEMSCDEAVIGQLGQKVKKNYSQSLLNLTTGKRKLSMTPLAFGEGETKGRIKNIINFKKPNSYIIIIALLILGVVFIGLMTNPKKDSEDFAKAFLEIVTNPEDLESTKYFRDVLYSETTSQYSMKDYIDSLKKDYGYLMTDKAYDNAVSNRFIPWAEIIREDTNNNIKVDSIDLFEMDVYDDGRVYYGYLLSLRVFFDDGGNEAVTVSGDIVMIEENSSWIVDAFRWNSNYQDLNKLLLPIPTTEGTGILESEEIPEMISLIEGVWVNTDKEIIVEIDEGEIIGEIRSDDIFDITGKYNIENSKIVGSNYAYFEDVLVVKIEDKWILFSSIEEWAKDNNIDISGGFMSIGYDLSHEATIFGDLNKEEINNITEEIMAEVEEDDDYEKNKDLIIEKVFKDNVITDPDKINAAKSKLIISN